MYIHVHVYMYIHTYIHTATCRVYPKINDLKVERAHGLIPRLLGKVTIKLLFPNKKSQEGSEDKARIHHHYYDFHTGSPQIDPEFQSDETTSRQLATNHGGRVLNLTDEQILWEYTTSGGRNKSSSVSAATSGIIGVILSIVALGGVVAGLALGYKWYNTIITT